VAPRLRSNARTYEGELKDMISAGVPAAGTRERSFAAARLPRRESRDSEISLVNDTHTAPPEHLKHDIRRVSIDEPTQTDAWQYPVPPPRMLVESPPWWELRSRLMRAVNCIDAIPNTYVPQSSSTRRLTDAAALDRQDGRVRSCAVRIEPAPGCIALDTLRARLGVWYRWDIQDMPQAESSRRNALLRRL